MKLQRRIFIISGICALLLFGFLRLQPTNDFSAKEPGKEIEFLVQDGELGSSIAQKLEKQGVDVDEWNKTSKGMKLPKQVSKLKSMKKRK